MRRICRRAHRRRRRWKALDFELARSIALRQRHEEAVGSERRRRKRRRRRSGEYAAAALQSLRRLLLEERHRGSVTPSKPQNAAQEFVRAAQEYLCAARAARDASTWRCVVVVVVPVILLFLLSLQEDVWRVARQTAKVAAEIRPVYRKRKIVNMKLA